MRSCPELVKFSITIAGLQQIVLIHPLVQIARLSAHTAMTRSRVELFGLTISGLTISDRTCSTNTLESPWTITVIY